MDGFEYAVGDMVFAAENILNDGGIPGAEADALIAPAGMRGLIVNQGHAEADESSRIYLVRFESGPDGALGDPVGCLPEELTQDIAA